MKQAALQTLMRRGADLRQKLWGNCTVEFFDGRIAGQAAFTVAGYHSSFRKTMKSNETGFLQPHDAVVRVPKSAGFIPQVNKFIRVTLHDPPRTQFEMRIMEFPHHTAGAEWALGCKALHAAL